VLLQNAQDKLQKQAASHEMEINKYRSIIESFKSKGINDRSRQIAHGRIARPLRGGVKPAESEVASPQKQPNDVTPDEDDLDKKSSFWSLFRSPAKKTSSTPTQMTSPDKNVHSPRADKEKEIIEAPNE